MVWISWIAIVCSWQLMHKLMTISEVWHRVLHCHKSKWGSHIFNATRCLYDTARCHMTLPDVLWRCQMSIWRDRMSIWCCKMSKWRCKAKFLKAARILGCTAFCMYCQESRHVNNGSQHSSTRVTSNILFLGREVILPKDLFQAPPPL